VGENHDHIIVGSHSAAKQIAAAAPCVYSPEHDICIARFKGDRLLGGVIYQGYTGASIEMHVAGFDPHWLSRNMLWAVFSYPFIQLGCLKVIGRVNVSDSRALEFDLKLGFIVEARISDVYPDGDLFILTVRRDDCHWLRLAPRGRFWEQPNG